MPADTPHFRTRHNTQEHGRLASKRPSPSLTNGHQRPRCSLARKNSRPLPARTQPAAETPIQRNTDQTARQQTQGLAGTPRPVSRRTLDGLDGRDRLLATAAGLTDDILAIWPDRFSIRDIIDLNDARISPEQALAWPERFAGVDIAALATSGTNPDTVGVTPEQATRWPERFSGRTIVVLETYGIAPDEALAWPRRFTGDDIVDLDDHGVEAHDAHQWPTWASAGIILACIRRGITADELVALGGGDPGPNDPSLAGSHRAARRLFPDGDLMDRIVALRPPASSADQRFLL